MALFHCPSPVRRTRSSGRPPVDRSAQPPPRHRHRPWRRRSASAAAAALSLGLALVAPSTAVPFPAPDRTFGASGTTTVDLGGLDTVSDVALLPDRRIVVVGSSQDADGVARAAVALLLPSGRPDPTFGRRGTVLAAGTGPARAVAVAPGGRIVVATQGGSLLRYTLTGALDGAFSGDGVLEGVDRYLSDVAVRRDGSVVALGDDVTLVSARGVVRAVMPAIQDGGGGFHLLGVQSSGHVVVVGASDCNLALAQRLDPALATATWLATPVGTASVGAVVLPADKVLVLSDGLTDGACGIAQDGIVLERYLASGERDPSFGVDGAVAVDQSAWPARAARGRPLSLARAANGSIVVLGSTYLARFTAAGAPDRSFSGDGVLPLPDGAGSVVAAQTDRHVVVVGARDGDVVVRRYLGGPWVVAHPSSVSVSAGRLTGGGRDSLAAADGTTLHVASEGSPGSARTTWSATVRSVPDASTSLRVRLVSAGSSDQVQSLSAWSVRRGTWVEVDTRTLRASGRTTVDRALPGDPADFVSGSGGLGQVRLRVDVASTEGVSTRTDLLAVSFR